MIRRRCVTTAAVSMLLLAACGDPAESPAEPAADTAATTPHGYVPGAVELSDPQTILVVIDAAGAVRLLDLLTGQFTELGTVAPPVSVQADGRFVYSAGASGVDIIDSGVWTVDHEDHSHYYRAEPRVVGWVPGQGPAEIRTSGDLTALTFPGSRDTVVLRRSELAAGQLRTSPPLQLGGQEVIPIGDTLLAATTQPPDRIQAHRLDGAPVVGASAVCSAPGEALQTRLGVLFECREGAVLATETSAGELKFSTVPYPAGTPGDSLVSSPFAQRPHRPTVAAVAGTTGFWLLDTRAETWTLIPTETPLQVVTAVDDSDDTVVGVDRTGQVVVYAGSTGQLTGRTRPPGSTGSAEENPITTLQVDSDRAYLNVGNTLYEIDYADSARISRTVESPTAPAFFAETGR